MATDSFDFEGGERLTGIGVTWFVSYSYFENVNKKHRNWAKASNCPSRSAQYMMSRRYHIGWLKEVLTMNPTYLNNNIGLDVEQVKAMASKSLSVMEQRGEQITRSKSLASLDKKVNSTVESIGKNAEKFTNTLWNRIEKNVEIAFDTIEKGVTNLGVKIDNINQADIEKFFCKIGRGIATLFTVTLPRFIKKTIAFFSKIMESDGWGIFAPFLFLLIGLVVLFLIATKISSLFS